MGTIGKINPYVILVVIFAMVAIGAVVFQSTLIPASIAGDKVTDGAVAVTACGSDNKGVLNMRVVNPLNTTGQEYFAASGVINEITASGAEVPAGIVFTTNANNTYAKIDFTCGKKYKGYVLSSDNVHTSASFEFNGNAETITLSDLKIPQHSALLFRAYNNDEKAYMYSGGSTVANAWVASGNTIFSTTSNSTGTTVGIGECVDFNVEVWANTTYATDTQYTDQKTHIAVNLNSAGDNDWQIPTVWVDGVSLIQEQMNLRLANDGYDYQYIAPVIMGQVKHNVRVQACAISGINPDADITVGVFTSGYAQSISDGNKIINGISNDNVGTYTMVYAGQTVIFNTV